ncbi:endonuclease III [Segnochrobactrum spirostomi]|uniref:Endonuclease III n=1 Tax=Segnochrobactrum spirostomi TaxID=2608987 RepID=A0A6A7Y1Z7_9HYPH|nr:endonuclease III [Segnochrobactrum spirostomi]MQT13023.1 endonuclease III [Segnochrobactrum spirostomi]
MDEAKSTKGGKPSPRGVGRAAKPRGAGAGATAAATPKVKTGAAKSAAAKAPAAEVPAGAAAKPARGKRPPTPQARAAAAKAKPLPGAFHGGGAYSADEVETIFARFAAAAPAPKSDLEYVNPFTLLVAVVLSAQATDAGVNKATRGLFAQADTAEKMAALGEDAVREAIKTIGLFRTKAKNVVTLSEILVSRYGGEVPHDREALEALPGVGRKTANVVLNVAFGEPTLAVDTHIFRVANRILLAPGKTPDAVEAGLMKIIPPAYLHNAHHWLILHGRYTCVARRPRCEVCLIADLCKSPEKTVPA